MTSRLNNNGGITPLPAGENRVRAATETVDAREVAAKVQSMFMEVMLEAMEDSVKAEDGLFGKTVSFDIYRGMLREHLSSAMSAKMESPLENVIDRALSRAPEAETHGAPVNGVVSSPHYHTGIDIAAPEGTPIRAVAGGRVTESGLKSGYGSAVVIETEDGRKMLYAHSTRNLVRVGDWVSSGEPIAEVGSTGRSTGPHVHF